MSIFTPRQLPLPGLDGSPCPANGLFFAVFLDPDATATFARLGRDLCGEHKLTGRPLAPGRLHVSLYGMGSYADLPPGLVAAAREAGAAVAMRPFGVAFNRAMSFAGSRGNRAFVLGGDDGVAGLMTLHQHLGATMKKAGLWKWVKRQYTPHVTLVYDQRCVTERVIETVGWTVREFILVHSLRGRTQYRPLGRWPLRG